MFFARGSIPYILAWIVVGLLALYVLGFLFRLVRVLIVRGKMRKKAIAIAVLFSNKKELLLALSDIYRQEGIPFSFQDRISHVAVEQTHLGKMRNRDILDANAELSDLERRLGLLAGANHLPKDDPKTRDYWNSLADLNRNYRRIAASYNSLLTAYEYWRNSYLYRWLFHLVRVSRIQRLA